MEDGLEFPHRVAPCRELRVGLVQGLEGIARTTACDCGHYRNRALMSDGASQGREREQLVKMALVIDAIPGRCASRAGDDPLRLVVAHCLCRKSGRTSEIDRPEVATSV